MFYKIITALLIAALFFGCGGSSDKSATDTTVTTMPDFAILDDDNLTVGTTSVTGSGSFTFTEPASDDATNLKVNFSLVDEDSYIEFYAFSDAKLTKSSSVVIKIQKSAGQLIGTLSIAGSQTIDLNLAELSDATNSLYIDVHNDEEPTHVLVWAGNETTFNEENAIFNSENSPEINLLGQKAGSALFVGVKLENATLSGLQLQNPKFED